MAWWDEMLGPPSAYAMTPEEVEAAVNKQYSDIHRVAPHLRQGDRWDSKWEGFRDYGPMPSPQTMATAMARLRDLLERANPELFGNVEKLHLGTGDNAHWDPSKKSVDIGMSREIFDSEPFMRNRWRSVPEFIHSLVHEGVHSYGDIPKGFGYETYRDLMYGGPSRFGVMPRGWKDRTAIPQVRKQQSLVNPKFVDRSMKYFRRQRELLPNVAGWAFAKHLYPGAEVPERFPEGYRPTADEFLKTLKLLDAFDKWRGK